MARLTAQARRDLPAKDFAGPGESYPIPDANHARAALSMAHYASDPDAIKAAVHRKFPQIGRSAMLKHMKGA